MTIFDYTTVLSVTLEPPVICAFHFRHSSIVRPSVVNVRSSKLVGTFVQHLDMEDRFHPRSYLEQEVTNDDSGFGFGRQDSINATKLWSCCTESVFCC